MIQILFIGCVVTLWSLVLWNLYVARAGARFSKKHRGTFRVQRRDEDLPGISILVPAHNEGRVMERSLKTFLNLEYPRDRFEIIVIDDASTDETGAICDDFAARDDRVRVIHVPPAEGGKGKSIALNRALEVCRFPYVAVYDADNRPYRSALKHLASALSAQGNGRYAAAVGRIVKFNRRATILNRFCAMEFSAFQWSMQAGRAQLFDLVLITGTNFLIETETVRALGGWDPGALTEDLELSVRLYKTGRRIMFVPEAVSEEQDPQQLRPWIRQRVRWMQGNFYVMRRHAGSLFHWREPRVAAEIFSLTFVYAVFLFALIASDVIAIAGAIGAIHFTLPGPYLALWVAAFLVFIATFQLTQALEGEDSWRTPVLATLMYVTYTQLWIYVALKSVFRSMFFRRQLVWDKTPRSHA